MAEQAHAVTHHHGHMPVEAQASTYHGVMDLFKWGALGTADLLILLIMWFCTAAGFVPAFIVAAIILVAGIFGLRGGKAAAH
jgi:hypothetical protein